MKRTSLILLNVLMALGVSANVFTLTEGGYFRSGGVDVMAFSDFYPEGHQGGIGLIMNGKRIATNGDIRLEATPGQWQAVPKQLSRKVEDNAIVTTLCYPDSSRHLTGFNPMLYPDIRIRYSVLLEPDGSDMLVTVNLDEAIPDEYVGKVGFNLELFPGVLFGQPWLMDAQTGIFPQQANGPVSRSTSVTAHLGDFHLEGKPLADEQKLRGNGDYSPIVADDILGVPYAVGRVFTLCPDDPDSRVTIIAESASDLMLYDGRIGHNNGWFVLRTEVPAGATTNAIRWRIRPTISKDWRYTPVIQTSQVGYLPNAKKVALIEADQRTATLDDVKITRLTPSGEQVVTEITPREWGDFLRYRYFSVDFSSLTEEGMYVLHCGESKSSPFRIASDVYARGVWQPVVEYFLPVQMCHMRVNEKYRVWHDRCHMDDALMAENGNHIDGYVQEPHLSPYQPKEQVPGVNVGGWHDAGDFDLRIESQAGECYILSLAYENFHPEIDVTAIDQQTKTCEIHQPDGRNDILQQIEHGALSIVSGYRALGRLYRGIICGDLRQYVLLGDAAAMTDHIAGTDDDRRIYTENNPARELTTAAELAATARVLRGYNDTLSAACLDIARALYAATPAEGRAARAKIQAAAELYISTEEDTYLGYVLDHPVRTDYEEGSLFNPHWSVRAPDWYLVRIDQIVSTRRDRKAKAWRRAFHESLKMYSQHLRQVVESTPYGVPYQPSIWGAGWDIQRFGFENYFLAAAYPDLFPADPICNALNFVLGCHPGSNTASFASGVGAVSATVGYGLNRADWSYIPGGVISGTALIRPDFPELLTWPYLWQQTEYVLGGGSSHYMFLVLAVQALMR